MKRFMQKTAALLLAVAICVPLASGIWATASSGKSGGITVESDKSGTQTVGNKSSLGAFPYGTRIKAEDLIGYKVSDFIDSKNEATGSLDKKAGGKPAQLSGSNWYLAGNITEYLSTLAVSGSVSGYGLLVGETVEEEVPLDAEAPAAVAPRTSASASSMDDVVADEPVEESAEGAGFSTTTIQVEGVDEADIIKTDGKYIYYLNSNNGIAIVQAGKSPKQVAAIRPGIAEGVSLPYYQDMYISGKKLIVSAVTYNSPLGSEFADKVSDLRYGQSTAFYVYDLSTPSKPVLDRCVEISGYLSTSRMYNNSIYFVINDGHYFGGSSDLLTALPLYRDSALGDDVYAFSPTDIYLSVDQSYGSSFAILGAFNLDDGQGIRPKAYQGYADAFYMNKNAFYMTSSYYYWGSDVRPLRDGLTFTAPSMGNSNNAMVINRFALNKNGMQFQAMGSVPGYVINQYSMDEYNGTFRIATTSYDTKTYISSNNVYVLDAKSMKQLGSVTGLAKNELIQSVRFRGDTGYVVTFENTDPLFVIDLKDSKNPKVVGELKIPGFSTYLHPFTDKYVIGLGRETSETYTRNSDGTEVVVGFVESGVKLSMFDVSDPKNPKEVHKLVIGGQGSYSEAINDPKAIMFDMEKGIMAFPIQYNDVSTSKQGKQMSEKWNGGVVAEFTTKGFTLGAKIKMDDYYSSYGSRFVYIDNVLYYVADKQLVAMDYSNYSIVNHIDLKFK